MHDFVKHFVILYNSRQEHEIREMVTKAACDVSKSHPQSVVPEFYIFGFKIVACLLVGAWISWQVNQAKE